MPNSGPPPGLSWRTCVEVLTFVSLKLRQSNHPVRYPTNLLAANRFSRMLLAEIRTTWAEHVIQVPETTPRRFGESQLEALRRIITRLDEDVGLRRNAKDLSAALDTAAKAIAQLARASNDTYYDPDFDPKEAITVLDWMVLEFTDVDDAAPGFAEYLASANELLRFSRGWLEEQGVATHDSIPIAPPTASPAELARVLSTATHVLRGPLRQ